MKQQLELKDMPEPKARVYNPAEFKVVALRECNERENPVADTPDCAAAYWRRHVETSPMFNPEVESLVVLFVNTRRRVKGHQVVSNGTLDTILAHPVSIFRAAVIMSAAAIILMHNHPSGDPSPSEGDIKVTRDLIRGGQLLKVELLDHVIMGKPGAGGAKDFSSLRELGYFSM